MNNIEIMKKEHAEMVAALRRIRQAFFVDGSTKAMKKALEGTQDIIFKIIERTGFSDANS